MHVRVKFFDERRGARDTARHPFEGQPHSGSRRAKCPHLVDIREGQAARSRTGLPGSDEGHGPAGSRRSGHPALPTGSAPSSEAHTNRQQRFILPARRYEARSLIRVGCQLERHPSQHGDRPHVRVAGSVDLRGRVADDHRFGRGPAGRSSAARKRSGCGFGRLDVGRGGPAVRRESSSSR